MKYGCKERTGINLMKKTMIAISIVFSLLATPTIAAPLVGGWTITEDSSITPEAHAVFVKAMEELDGADYEPIDLLATQIVSGTNYCFLCRIAPVVPDPVHEYAFVYIYEDLQGNAEMVDVQEISFGMRPVYSITVSPDSDAFLGFDCPESAKAGETVILHTDAGVDDGDIYVSVNGDKDFGSFISYGDYEFVMPETDVEIKYWVEGNGLA